LGWRMVASGAGPWKPYLSDIWPELLFNVRSFDPDIIDLRSIRHNGYLKRKLERDRWHVVSSDTDMRNLENPNTAWRTYDASKKVSIVLPVHNGQTYLRESIESCLKQTHRNFELIIVD